MRQTGEYIAGLWFVNPLRWAEGNPMLARLLQSVSKVIHSVVMTVLLAVFWTSSLSAQISRQDSDRARKMLEQLRKDLHEFYYDSTFGGLDIDARARQSDSAIQVAPNMNYALGILAQYLADLKDSHTSFAPPNHVAKIDYGFSLLTIGDSVYVNYVKKGSDAEAKGLKRGDLVLAFDQMRLLRSSLHVIQYVYYRLSPRPVVTLAIRRPGEQQLVKLAIAAKITEGKRVIDYTDMSEIGRIIREMEDDSRAATHYYRSLGDSVLVWRMPEFVYGDSPGIDDMIERAKRHRAVIFDLRNCPGGSVDTELYLLGRFFDREVNAFTMRERKKATPQIAKPSRKPYLGMLVVLVNSNSASAAEIFARVMQIEGRGIVVGDRSAGAVITSIFYPHLVGFDRVLEYGASLSIADVIMSDGKRLENVGVMPDHRVLPSGDDLATRRDPQMAKAFELVGVKATPELAAVLGKTEAKKSDDQK